MNRFDRAAVLTELAEQLRLNGSWTGETHLQKATYVLQVLLGVPLEFDFVLYKHGPFSFDLREELTSVRADGLLEQVPQAPYGPTLRTTDMSRRLREEREPTIDAHRAAISFVAERLAGKGIFQLEQLGTALYVRVNSADVPVGDAAEELHLLKPHVTIEAAQQAITELDALAREAHLLLAGPMLIPRR